MKKLGKMTLLLGAAFAAVFPAAARQLTAEEALQRALLEGAEQTAGSLRLPATRSLGDYKLVHTFEAEKMNTMYVFNSSDDNSGYMILSADDAADYSLIGFSDHGSFDASLMPENMKWFLECASARVAAMANSQFYIENSTLAMTEGERHDVAPLCATRWDQSAPYWDMCPKEGTENTFTGCAATALAQVMKVHNWPETGEGSISYTSKGIGTVSVDFSKSTYDWDHMLNSYKTTSTAQEREAVAKLMFDCGAAMEMQYSTVGSGATMPAVAKALVEHFKYSKNVRPVNRDVYTYDQFVKLLYNEMAAGCPVVVGGSNWMSGSYYGHAFVVDGFRANGSYFHLNWGWGGLSNGYFLINALDPAAQGAGGSASGYNINCVAIIGISPEREATQTTTPYLFCNTPFITKQGSYERGNINVDFFNGMYGRGIFNYTPAPSPIRIRPGVKLVNEDTNEEMTIMTTAEYEMVYQSGYVSFPLRANRFPNDGNWMVTAGYTYGGVWYDLPIDLSLNRSLRLEASNKTLLFTPATELPALEIVEMNVPEEAYLRTPFHVTAKVRAIGGEFYQRLMLVVMSATNNSTLAYLDMRQVDVLEGQVKELEWFPAMGGSDNLRAGSFRIALCILTDPTNYAHTPISGGVKPIKMLAKQPVDYSLTDFSIMNATGAGVTAFTPATINLAAFSAKMDISVTSGYFADMVSTVFFDRQGNTAYGETPQVFLEVTEGENASVTMTGDVQGLLDPNVVYMAVPWGVYTGQLGQSLRYVRATAAGVEEVTVAENEVEIMPTAVVADFNVSAPSEVATVEVFAVSGAKVAQVKGSNSTVNVDLSAAPAGHYVVRVMLVNGTIVNRQIIKR